jgi:hypothetical protein
MFHVEQRDDSVPELTRRDPVRSNPALRRPCLPATDRCERSGAVRSIQEAPSARRSVGEKSIKPRCPVERTASPRIGSSLSRSLLEAANAGDRFGLSFHVPRGTPAGASAFQSCPGIEPYAPTWAPDGCRTGGAALSGPQDFNTWHAPAPCAYTLRMSRLVPIDRCVHHRLAQQHQRRGAPAVHPGGLRKAARANHRQAAGPETPAEAPRARRLGTSTHYRDQARWVGLSPIGPRASTSSLRPGPLGR